MREGVRPSLPFASSLLLSVPPPGLLSAPPPSLLPPSLPLRLLPTPLRPLIRPFIMIHPHLSVERNVRADLNVDRGGIRAYAHELFVRVLVRAYAHANENRPGQCKREFVRACKRMHSCARAFVRVRVRSRVRVRACVHAHVRACVCECACAYLSITARSTHVRRSRTRSEHGRERAYVRARPLQAAWASAWEQPTTRRSTLANTHAHPESANRSHTDGCGSEEVLPSRVAASGGLLHFLEAGKNMHQFASRLLPDLLPFFDLKYPFESLDLTRVSERNYTLTDKCRDQYSSIFTQKKRAQFCYFDSEQCYFAIDSSAFSSRKARCLALFLQNH